jgi:mRNA interferase RelE/StbE
LVHEIRVAPAARRQLKKLPRETRQRIAHTIDDLAEHPRAGAEKLAGADACWRVRVGEYRVVYQVLDDQAVGLILKIGHRREVYR